MATRKQILDNNNNEILPITDTDAVRNPQSVGGTLESRISNIEKAIEDSDLLVEQNSLTDQQRNTALANVSNQTANSTTGKMGYKVLDPSKTFASQVTAENTIYEIRDVFELDPNDTIVEETLSSITNYLNLGGYWYYYNESTTLSLQPSKSPTNKVILLAGVSGYQLYLLNSNKDNSISSGIAITTDDTVYPSIRQSDIASYKIGSGTLVSIHLTVPVVIEENTYFKYVDGISLTSGQKITASGCVIVDDSNTILGSGTYTASGSIEVFIARKAATYNATLFKVMPFYEIPANCTLKFNGGILKSGTLNCNNIDIDAGLVKIFDNIAFIGTFVQNFDKPEWYGYMSGTDLTPFVDTIYQTFNSVRLSKRTYNVNSELRIRGNFYAKDSNIALSSSGLLSTQNDDKLQGLHYVTINIHKIYGASGKTTPYGLKIHNLNSSVVKIDEITRFGDCCILIEATKGVAYNRFNFGHVHEASNCLIRVKTVINGSVKGWVNGNYFDSIRFSNGYGSNSNPNPNGRCMIWEDNSITDTKAFSYYGNVITDSSFEGISNNLFDVANFAGNIIQNCAIDGCPAPYINVTGNKCFGNKIAITAGNIYFKGDYCGFEKDYIRKNCHKVIYDSGPLGKIAKLNAAGTPNFYYLPNMRMLHYNNGSSSFPLQINDDLSITNIGTDNTYKTTALAFKVSNKIKYSLYGLSVDSIHHSIGIRYTKYLDDNNVEQTITLNDSSVETDTLLKTIGYPTCNTIINSGASFIYNATDGYYHRFWLDRNNSNNTYFEFSVPPKVTEFMIYIQIGTIQNPNLKRFILTSTEYANYVVETKELHIGTTAERMYKYIGYEYYDLDLGKKIMHNGNAWVNLDGTPLTQYTITQPSDSNVTNDNIATSIEINKPYIATLGVVTGYTLDVSSVQVTMGGVDITSFAFNSTTGVIYIAGVTGNIVIIATATQNT